ncbi:unnamed protein product [Blepharisma stoltei]|uniref:Uncharacterized protein n=1 Tax=Blepharisma stoltei TaxID=1481888 RepID=A0AAU9IV10_9CILI|nr:unnamed protein product [Blepharisma stoltei]
MLFLLALLPLISATNFLDHSSGKQSFWDSFGDWLLQYPMIGSFSSIFILFLFFALYIHCRKRLQENSGVRTLIKSRRLNSKETKPFKL